MDTATTATATALIDRYCDAWSAADPQRRAELLRAVWSPDATYCDPGVEAHGTDALLAHLARVQARWPGARIHRTSAVDAHHRAARFAWAATLPDGSRLIEGLDLALLSEDGTRIERIVGFFGPLEARA